MGVAVSTIRLVLASLGQGLHKARPSFRLVQLLFRRPALPGSNCAMGIADTINELLYCIAAGLSLNMGPSGPRSCVRTAENFPTPTPTHVELIRPGVKISWPACVVHPRERCQHVGTGREW
eukprot:1077012-Pelagomonas_calceolata.AAC.1